MLRVWYLKTNMAGLSNAKFLAPSYFTKTDGNTAEKSSKNTTLMPPSTYEKVETDIARKTVSEKSREVVNSLERENSELRETIGKLLQEKRRASQSVVQKKKREESLQTELHLAKRMAGDLAQEKEMLQYELQDRDEALSGVVPKLKKELRKAKEKLSTKEKAMVEKTQEHSETARHLRSELKQVEDGYLGEISRLKENCSKHIEDVKYLGDKNSELRKKLAEKEREFDSVLCEKEQERDGLSEISKNKLEKLEEARKQCKEHSDRLETDNKILETELSKEKEKCSQFREEVSLKESLIDKLQDRVKTLEEDRDKASSEHNNRVLTFEEDSRLNVEKLEVIIQSKEEKYLQQHQMHTEKLQEKEAEIKELVRSVEQLRSYIGEIRPSQEAQKLSELGEQLTNTVQVLTEENDTLHSTVRLLNVRLSSILEIVAIQETELTRNDDLLGKSRDSEGLLRKWREKVFALMVQLRCQKIVESDQERKDAVQLNNVNDKLEDLQREHCVLTHKLADKEATLELEGNLRKTKSQELEKLNKHHNVLKNQQNTWMMQFQTLWTSTQAVEKTLLQSLSHLKRAVSKMSSFDQRMKFAACRVHFISEFLSNRDTQQKAKSLDNESISCEDGEISPDGDSKGNGEHHLNEEVKKLLKERAVLLSETKKHNETLREKTSEITREYETVVEEKNERIEKLEASGSGMKEKILVLQENVESKTEDLDGALESIEELKLTLTKQRTAIEKGHREAFEKERLRNTEDMQNLEGQLNDVRREHAKAVAALKNAERQVSREKENSSKMVGNIEREFDEKLARCEKQLKNVEKERNLLMVKIREEKKNVPRIRPLTAPDMASEKERPVKEKVESNIKLNPQLAKQSMVTSETRAQRGSMDTEGQGNIGRIDPTEAFAALKELKILSEQIVKMHGDDGNFSDSEY